MAKVLGVGGIFFKSRDPKRLYEWYAKCLGMELSYGSFGGFMDPDGNKVELWEPSK